MNHPLTLISNHPGYGTSLVGYITTTYAHLVACLGAPHERDGDKTTAHWGYQCADGTLCTIYDWKTAKTPLGVYRWHVGGNRLAALQAVKRLTGVEAIPFD